MFLNSMVRTNNNFTSKERMKTKTYLHAYSSGYEYSFYSTSKKQIITSKSTSKYE